jgi:hypothetical protein
MRRRIAITLIITLVAATLGWSGGPAAAAARHAYTSLDPGGRPRLAEKVPVNVVFLGYEPSQVDKAAYLSGLPKKYEPVVQSRLAYDVVEKLGITYTYDYHVTYGSRAYEDTFFGQLRKLSTPAP